MRYASSSPSAGTYWNLSFYFFFSHFLYVLLSSSKTAALSTEIKAELSEIIFMLFPTGKFSESECFRYCLSIILYLKWDFSWINDIMLLYKEWMRWTTVTSS
jgi:hypothetical protein